MNWKDLIATLKKIEGADKLTENLETEITKIEGDRYKAISNEQERGRQLHELQKLLDGLDLAGENSTEKAKALTEKVKTLTDDLNKSQQQIKEFETSKQELESSKSELEKQLGTEKRRVQIRDAAFVSKANARVLETILDSDALIEIATSENGDRQVMIVKGEDKKPLRDYVTINAPDFLPSLFPSDIPIAPSTPPRQATLPSGTPNAQAKPPIDVVKSYVASAGYGFPDDGKK